VQGTKFKLQYCPKSKTKHKDRTEMREKREVKEMWAVSEFIESTS
jgi:hypothetical protein